MEYRRFHTRSQNEIILMIVMNIPLGNVIHVQTTSAENTMDTVADICIASIESMSHPIRRSSQAKARGIVNKLNRIY